MNTPWPRIAKTPPSRRLRRILQARPWAGLVAALALTTADRVGAESASVSVSKRPEAFVALRDVDPEIRRDMRYATERNFTGRRLPGYEKPLCLLTGAAAAALSRVRERLRPEGLGLVVFDCYRPARAIRFMNAWLAKPEPLPSGYFYSRLSRAEIARGGFIAKRSTHATGGAVDLALFRLDADLPRPTGEKGRCDDAWTARAKDTNLDMGTSFDCFSDKSATASPAVSKAARRNRRILLEAMRAEGFANYRREWWHFVYAARAFKRVQFEFPVE